MNKKTIAVIIVVFLGLIGYLVTSNVYTSSPGNVRGEAREQFNASRPDCYGFSVLLNRKATWADAPGVSVCIGLLVNKNM